MHFFENGTIRLRAAEGDGLRVVTAGDTCFELGGASAVPDILAGRSAGILRGVAPCLDAADLRIIQWETALTEAETPIDKTGPNLKAPPGCAAFGAAGRFDVALLANNHVGDYGPAAALETRAHLERQGVRTVGVGATLAEAARPLVLERNGFRLAVVNAAENEFGMARDDRPGAAPLELTEMLRTIRAAAAAADLVLVYLHGGTEQDPVPSPRMVRTARAFVDAGAHAVFCIHAHCPQGIEVYRDAPIVYCPGNFFFPKAPFEAANFWWTGYLTTVAFDRRGAVGLEILPYTFRPDPWRIEPLPAGPCAAFHRYLAELSALVADPREVRRLFEAWSAARGLGVLEGLCGGHIPWPKDLRDRAQVRTVLGLRNLLTCEAHHEMLAAAMRLVEEGRVESALREWPRLQALQSARFLVPEDARA